MHLNSDVLQHYSAQNMIEMAQVVNCIKQGTDSPVVAIRVIIIDDDIWRSSHAHISLYKESCYHCQPHNQNCAFIIIVFGSGIMIISVRSTSCVRRSGRRRGAACIKASSAATQIPVDPRFD